MMKNKPWKTWKTRKVTFIAVCILWAVTAILGLCGCPVEQGIIDFIYGAGRWLLTFGITLVLADKVADKIVARGGSMNE